MTVPSSGDRERGAGALAEQVLSRLTASGDTLAVAESLTGGLLCATLVAVPGASAGFRGGIVSYATDLKALLLGVDEVDLQRTGPVDPDVAEQMADGVREATRSTWGMATTGVAGPSEQDGHPPGEVYVAVTGPRKAVRRLTLDGERAEIRSATVAAALRLLLELLPDTADGTD